MVNCVLYLLNSAKNPKPFWGAYSLSKAALEQMIYSWHLENKKSKIKVYIIHPKPINTKLRKAAMPGEDEKKIKHLVTQPLNCFLY